MPLTLLRIDFIGVGEMIIIVLFLNELRKPLYNIHVHDFTFSKFWIYILILSFLGFLYNLIVLDLSTGTLKGMLFDTSAYILVLISCFTLENYRKRNNINFIKIFRLIFFSSGFLLTVLYFISLRTDTIFDLPLRYFSYFSPLSKNIHQMAMFIAPMPFIGLFVLKKENNKYLKILSLFLIVMLIIMSLETGSFKGKIGVMLGGAVYLYFKIVNFFRGRIKNFIIIISVTLIFISFLINYDTLEFVFTQIFNEEDMGHGRSWLYLRGFEIGMSSPIIGRGSGGHILDGDIFYDSHQTFLTVFIQTGIIGVFLLFKLIYKMIKNLFKIPELFAAFIPILLYVLGGDILRRLPIWILMVLFYYYSISQSKTLRT